MFSSFTPKSEKSKLKFPLKDFNIFTEGGDDGVILKMKTKSSTTYKWDSDYRSFEPEIGDFVGLLTHSYFKVFQIYAIGVIVKESFVRTKPSYNVFVIDVDPLEWKQIGMTNYLGTRVTDIPIGVSTNLKAREVVTFDSDKKQFASLLNKYQSQIDYFINENDSSNSSDSNMSSDDSDF